MKIKNSLVSPNSNLLEALEKLEKTACKLIIVVNKSNKILGILTDGDLRKYVLSNKSLTVSVSQVMNKNYFSINVKDKTEKGFLLMKKHRLTHIPVLDDQKIVRDILSFDQLISEEQVSNPVVIMAGGKGMRMRPFTNDCPKPMLRVNGIPILEIIIKKFIKQGFDTFFISVNYLKEQIIDYFKDGEAFGIKIEYLIEDEPLGTAGSLKLLDITSNDPLIIMNGDLLTEINFRELINFHNENQSEATMAVLEYEYSIPYGVVEVEKNNLVNFKEKPSYQYLINAGIYIVHPRSLKYLKINEYAEMPDLLNKLKNHNARVSVYKLKEFWLDIGSKESYREAYKYLG